MCDSINKTCPPYRHRVTIAKMAVMISVAFAAWFGINQWLNSHQHGSARGPHLLIDAAEIDLGEVNADAITHTRVILRNSGDQTLHIQAVLSECGCTSAIPAAKVIEPGKSTELVISFDANGFYREIRKRVIILSDDPAFSRRVIALSAYVKVGLRLDQSQGRLFLGSGRRGDVLGKSVKLVGDPGSGTPSVSPPKENKGIAVTVSNWTQIDGIAECVVKVTAALMAERAGMHNIRLEIKADNAIIPLDVSYELLPPIRYDPAEVIIAPQVEGSGVLRLSWSPADHVSVTKAGTLDGRYIVHVEGESVTGCTIRVQSMMQNVQVSDSEAMNSDIIYIDYHSNADDNANRLLVPVRMSFGDK